MGYYEGNVAANAKLAGATVKQETVSSAIESFDAVITRAEQYASRLMSVRDRVHGSRPQEASNEAPPVPPHSVIDALHRRRVRLVSALDEIERHLVDLEGGI